MTLRASDAVTHYTPEEPDQPACDADVTAPPGTVMFGTLNPDWVTCPACQAITDEPDSLLRRRTPAERLRYLAGKLHDGDRNRLHVAVALEAMADEIDAATGARHAITEENPDA